MNDATPPDAPATFASFNELVHQSSPRVAIVLGSGLGSIAGRIDATAEIAFSSLPGLPGAGVEGHEGRLILGLWSGRPVLVFCGRLHRYEGHSWDVVLTPIRLLGSWGVRVLILTNAAGGIRDDLAPGSLMAIRDHLDWTRPWPGRRGGEVAGSWVSDDGSPPHHLTTLYSPRLLTLLKSAADACGLDLKEGRYAAVLGPHYETPAEIRALRALGADAVGMSTAREIESAAALGLECAAISCITNRAAGLSPARLCHEEVLENSKRQAARLGELLERFVSSFP